MAKVKISYDVNEREKASIIVNGQELIGLGVTGYELKVASRDSDTECRIGLDYLGHEIEFDGRVVVDGLRLSEEMSEAIVKKIMKEKHDEFLKAFEEKMPTQIGREYFKDIDGLLREVMGINEKEKS